MMQSRRASFDSHSSAGCDHCSQYPIIGIRYKCFCCPDYDLCDKCIIVNETDETNFHDNSHYFIRVAKDVKLLSQVPHILTNKSGMIHDGVLCTNCKATIVGFRYFCTTCAVNICQSCEITSMKFHNINHNLVRMRPPPKDRRGISNTTHSTRMLEVTSGRQSYSQLQRK